MEETSKSNEEKEGGKADKAEDNSPADVAFLYKTMLQRDPSKRKVKPVEQHLMQIHFGMSDDDDTDSDYEFKPGIDSDDDVGSDDSLPAPAKQSKTDSKDTQSSSEEETSDGDISGSELDTLNKPVASAPKIQFTLKVCCVCLSSSCVEDEIIECDGCGILVHEGCYGTIEEDALSVHSDLSTESTEPWFCDPCKAGVVPTCELCPNQFGIFKQTDTGRWVHLICALYVPAVAFGNTEKLTNVTLLEMPYTKWGAKECSLCEDENYSCTGVCIGCDAGMCRNYFHVTCAQRQGLLSEAALDEEIADPFYAHCKMHGDKLVSKQKKRNFLALHSHVKESRASKCNRPVSQRTKRRLEHFKKKFKEAEARRPPAWVPPNKLPRSISSSASAVNSLLRKAELAGVIVGSKATKQKEAPAKKSNIIPALTVDFVSYYEQRTSKIDSLKQLNEESHKQKASLQCQEQQLEQQVQTLRMTVKELQTTYDEHKQTGCDIFTALCTLSDNKINIPEKYKPTVASVPTAAAESKEGSADGSCGICGSKKEQHLLAKCDQCSKLYHLYCLDPPLTRMPKKSKLCGWVCSICDLSNQQLPVASDPPIDTDAPRRLRHIIREPDKFFQPELKLFVEKLRRNPANRARKRARTSSKKTPARKKPNKAGVKVVQSAEGEMGAKVMEQGAEAEGASPVKPGRRSKIQETGTCKPCQVECNSSSAVNFRCDGCSQWFHFSCLSPPLKKSPKHRGYQWYCDDCDETLDEADNPTTAPEAVADDGEHSQSLSMEIVQGSDSNDKTVVSFDGDVTTL